MSSPTLSGDFTPVFNPPLSSTQTKLLDMLEDATEQLMINTDFDASFRICDRGLECLAHEEEADVRGELKAGFCIVGIQALAELNLWTGVLAWVLKHYEHMEDIPAKILQMCILLYSKARELVVGELGGATFTEEQRQTALEIIEEEEVAHVNADCRVTASTQGTGSFLHKVEALLRVTYRRLTAASGSFPFHKLVLAAVILYMLVLRLDPALPSSFMWISKLHELLRQMWNFTAAPYYRAQKD
ncbi:peroxisome assembly protein 26 isoform X2 [Syngnathus typhle]|uniref:peroxisome assembly protein 26 isoform X2 n=1 Tax=Syngnathus typhle TaxID=161592 RepID=UPI002A6ADECB|nr:peroxisome assembly protein 26 isoform X2 [Syngnathus typhle]